MNLLFFLGFILVLGSFVALVFHSYRSQGDGSPSAAEKNAGIVTEMVTPGTDSCVYYVGTKLSETSHRFRSSMEIPATDDGFLRGLFEVPGVIGVQLSPKMVVIQKLPSASWDIIRPGTRAVLNKHLHMH